MSVFEIASAYLKAGLSVIPVAADGSKRPLEDWDQYKDAPPTMEEVERWFKDQKIKVKDKNNEWTGRFKKVKKLGIGVVGGAVSENVEIVDFENKHGRCVTTEWLAAVDALGGKELLERVVQVKTPSGGLHVYYRCPEIEAGQKLARFPGLDKNGKPSAVTLIETRAQGNYVIAPGSPPECHDTGLPYLMLSGKLNRIPVITADERALLLNTAREFNEVEEVLKEAPQKREPRPTDESDVPPGADFDRRATLEEVIEPHGWTRVRDNKWRKPGSKDGFHATWNHNDCGQFYVFSTNAWPLEGNRSYSLFALHTVLNHGGNFYNSAADLRRKGYGSKPPERTQITNGEEAPWKDPETISFEISSNFHGVLPENRVLQQPEKKRELVDLEPSNRKGQLAQLQDEEDDIVWEEPIPLLEAIKRPKLESEYLPDPLRNMVEQVAYVTQTPIDMAVLLCLSVLATCVQKKFKVTPGGEWLEHLCIWILIGAESGTRKSAVFDLLCEPIKEWEKQEAIRTRSERIRQEIRRDAIQARLKILKLKSSKMETDEARESILMEMQTLAENMPDEPILPELSGGDTNAEGLQKELVTHGGRWSILTEEGGIFQVIAGLYTKGQMNLDTFLQAHSGSDIKVSRAGRKVSIANPALTFGIMVQPHIVRDFGSNQAFRQTGFLARFLYAQPESNVGKRKVLRSRIPKSIKNDYATILTNLLNIPLESEPKVLTLSDEALSHFDDFSQMIEDECGEGKRLEDVKDWGSKLAGAALRIAALFHLVNCSHGNNLVISAVTMERALNFCELLIPHALYSFSTMAKDPVILAAKHLLTWIVRQGKNSIRMSDMQRTPFFREQKQETLNDAVNVLLHRRILKGPFAKKTRGRKSVYFLLSPFVIERGNLDALAEL